MDARHLALLRELADRGSITKVAAAGHRTPSAVSQQLRTAERELGVRLVEPAGRGVRLTEAGLVLADAAVEVQTALATAQTRLDELRGAPSGRVRIAALPSALEFLVAPALLALDQRITVEVDDIDVAEIDFAAHAPDVDVVIGHSLTAPVPAAAAGLVSQVLCREPIDVALPAGHRLAGRARLVAAELAEESWIGVPAGFPFDTVLRGIESASGRPVRVVQPVRYNRVVASLVRAGIGVALLPRFTCAEAPGLVLRELADVPALRWVVAMSRPDRAERAAVRRVLAVLSQVGADVQAGRDGRGAAHT